MRAMVRRLVARLLRRRFDHVPEFEFETWEPTRTTARDLEVHRFARWPDAAGVSWPGGLIECRDHLTPQAWAEDVSALVMRGRPGGVIHRRMPRLCQRCRETVAR